MWGALSLNGGINASLKAGIMNSRVDGCVQCVSSGALSNGMPMGTPRVEKEKSGILGVLCGNMCLIPMMQLPRVARCSKENETQENGTVDTGACKALLHEMFVRA